SAGPGGNGGGGGSLVREYPTLGISHFPIFPISRNPLPGGAAPRSIASACRDGPKSPTGRALGAEGLKRRAAHGVATPIVRLHEAREQTEQRHPGDVHARAAIGENPIRE